MMVCGRIPSQCTLSTDQPVTQWKSLIWRSPGSAATSLQGSVCGLSTSPPMRNWYVVGSKRGSGYRTL